MNIDREGLIKMEKDEDLPKTIVVILVVLAVAISVLGTFTVLTEMNRLNSAPVYRGNPTQSAQIRLEIEDPNQGLSQATGQITLTIENPEE